MAQELQEMGFSGFGSNPNYGAIDTNEKQEDFNDLKINLGQNQPEYEYKKTEPPDQEEQRMTVSSNNNDEPGDQQQQLTQAQIDQRANRCCNGVHPDYYQRYFDVTTQDVLQRITFSLVPMNNKLEQAIGENPDFYGPFWIYTTLIFLLAFAENLHNYIAVGYENFEYDFKNFPPSLTIVYGIGFGAPLLLCTVMKYLSDIEMKYKAITCIYGYSFTSLCICVTLCAAPVDILQWIAVVAALAVNIGVLFFNLSAELNKNAPRLKWVLVIGICILQIVLMMVFKLKFLHMIKTK